MAAAKSKKSAVSYRFQRNHHALISGHFLTVKQKREDPMRVFFPQSDIDGACGLHSLCSALVILDLAKSSALTDMSRRKHGVPAAVWAAFKNSYFSGVMPLDFVQLINALELPISVTARHGHEQNVDSAASDWLMQGDLVALAFESVMGNHTRHWALAVGVEGNVIGRQHVVDTLLLLDPGSVEPHFSVANARLKLPTSTARQRAKASSKPQSARRIEYDYECGDWPSERVHLLSAVRMKPVSWS